MQTIIIENKEKEFELILEYDKDGVSKAVINYRTPLPLSHFINCSAIAKTWACGSGMSYSSESYPSDAEGRRI